MSGKAKVRVIRRLKIDNPLYKNMVLRVTLMARRGFYASTIIREVKKHDRIDLSKSQLYRIVNWAGYAMTDYRKGIGHAARAVTLECNNEVAGLNRQRKAG